MQLCTSFALTIENRDRRRTSEVRGFLTHHKAQGLRQGLAGTLSPTLCEGGGRPLFRGARLSGRWIDSEQVTAGPVGGRNGDVAALIRSLPRIRVFGAVPGKS